MILQKYQVTQIGVNVLNYLLYFLGVGYTKEISTYVIKQSNKKNHLIIL